jgi:hypothetical protein
MVEFDIKSQKCWAYNKTQPNGQHHGIPVRINPVNNIRIPVCNDCHIKINKIDLTTCQEVHILKSSKDLGYG